MNDIQNISVDRIDPSPFQHRRYFAEDALAELARSIEQDGLVEPIVVRPHGKRMQLIAGERRVRAVRDFTSLKKILARIVDVDDRSARRMCAAENMQRADLSAVEAIEATVELLDAELLGTDETYDGYGATAVERVKTLLMKMDSDRRRETDHVSHKFMGQVESVFRGLPRPVEWRSFYENDLPIITKVDHDVLELAVQKRLNKSQTKALQKMSEDAPDVFKKVQSGVCSAKDLVPSYDPDRDDKNDLCDLSASEIRMAAARIRDEDGIGRLKERPVSGVDGVFDVIVIDPPWPMQKISRIVRPNQSPELTYPTMSIEELRGLSVPCADDCHVWVWTTHKFLPDCLELLEFWGLRYVCTFVWHKPGGIQPTGLPQFNCEFAVYCRRGAPSRYRK